MDFYVLCFILLVTQTRANIFKYNFKVLSSPKKLSVAIGSYVSSHGGILSSNCVKQLREYVDGLSMGEDWALKNTIPITPQDRKVIVNIKEITILNCHFLVFDASGKLPSGVLHGNYVELGSFDECLNVTTIRQDQKESKLSGKYCLGYLYVNKAEVVDSGIVPFTKEHSMPFSTCVPSDCTALDVQRLSAGIGISYLTITEDFCQTAGLQPEFDSLSITVATFFGCVALFMVLSTIYDLYNRFISNVAGVPNWILSSFSVYTNCKELFAIKHNSEEIECLHGLRVLAMVGVVIGHTFFVLLYLPIRNEYFLDHWLHQLQNMWLVKGDYDVEIFFLLSGILVSYSFMRKRVRNHKFIFIYQYLNRYLRLTPSVVALILFLVGLSKFLGSGPMWPYFVGHIIGPCKEYWWYNLLYITNYADIQCLGPTWFLAVDFQLFLISPILLILLKRWPKFGLVAIAFLIGCCMAIVFAMVWIFELRPSVLFNIRNFYIYSKRYFSFPVTRAPSWLIGLIFGYFLQIANDHKKSKPVAWYLLIFAVILPFICIFSVYPTLNLGYSRIGSSLHLALVTPTFSISIGCIIYCCHTGNGGIINTFLSHPVFKVLSNLNYSIYLVHYPAMVYTKNCMRVATFESNFGLFVYTIPGYLLLSFLLGLILSLSIELPVQIFVNVLMKKLNVKKESKYLAVNSNELQ